jgi:hypothetical protein
LIRYEPTLPRVGFGVAALIMTALTFGLMVVLPSRLESESPAFVVRAGAHRAAADPRAAGTLQWRCTVPAAVNAPLFGTARAFAADPRCKQQS